MTAREIKDLVGVLAEKQAWLVSCRKEINRQRQDICEILDQIDWLLEQIGRQTQEIDALLQTTGEEHRESLQEMRLSREEACLHLRDIFHRLRETAQSVRQTELLVEEQWQELNKQIGGLGNELSSFTELLVLPAMTEALTRRFHVDLFFSRVRIRKDGGTLELDALAYSSSGYNEVACVVAVEGHLREDALERMRSILNDFHRFFPEHAGRRVYGILAAVDVPDEVGEKVLREGLYLARIHDGQFDIQVPDGFQPRAFCPPTVS